jgi:hypothetical protein
MSTRQTPASDAEILAIVDRIAIFECLTRFSRGMDRLDRGLVLSTFHADAVCDYGPYVGSPEGLFDWAVQQNPSLIATHHHLGNHSCEIEGSTAHCETYLIYNARRADESIWQAHGRYIDRLEKRGGSWKIAMRYCVVEAMGQVSSCQMPFDGIADVDANGAAATDRSDPSYRRPLLNLRSPRTLSD